MLDLLNFKYDELKIYIKYNKDKRYEQEINNEIISLYSSILGYYSAKLDLKVNADNTERLKDKIMLQSFDKKLLEKLNISSYLDNFININSESKRGEFYSTLDFLELKNHLDSSILTIIRESYDDAYLKTLLNIRQNKLDKKNQNRIYQLHEKSIGLIKKCK